MPHNHQNTNHENLQDLHCHRGPSILLIDDHAESLGILADLMMTQTPGKVSQVPSAEAALKLLQQESFSIILSDYRLEGMDGVQFLEALRQSGSQTPVILLSGAPDKQGVLRASHQQHVEFLPKPFRLDDLRQAMDRLKAA